MTLTQLKIFITVAQAGSVTKAAEILGMTQSAASAAIASLENIYQVKLFERVGRSIELSETGQLFLPEAQNTLSSAMVAARSLRALSGETHGRLHIAASQTIANYWLPERLAIFHTRNPEVTLNVSMINTAAVEQAILKGTANVGFVEGKITANKLELIEVDHDQPVMVASAAFSGRLRAQLSPQADSLTGAPESLTPTTSRTWRSVQMSYHCGTQGEKRQESSCEKRGHLNILASNISVTVHVGIQRKTPSDKSSRLGYKSTYAFPKAFTANQQPVFPSSKSTRR